MNRHGIVQFTADNQRKYMQISLSTQWIQIVRGTVLRTIINDSHTSPRMCCYIRRLKHAADLDSVHNIAVVFQIVEIQLYEKKYLLRFGHSRKRYYIIRYAW